MEKQHSGKSKDVVLVVFFIVLVLMLIWVATAEGPRGNYYAYVSGYGNTITMLDRGIADVYSEQYGVVITPGVHLMNKEGKLVSPIFGGAAMALSGLLGGGGRELGIGLEGVRVGLRHNPVGFTVLIVLPLALIGLVGFRFVRSRKNLRNSVKKWRNHEED